MGTYAVNEALMDPPVAPPVEGLSAGVLLPPVVDGGEDCEGSADVTEEGPPWGCPPCD